MKEFDLEAAKAGKKVMTRDGRNARIVRFDYRGYAPLLVTVENKSEEPLSDRLKQYVQAKPSESVYEYYENGKVCAPHLNANIASDLDLVMATEKFEGWVNIFKSPTMYYTGQTIFETEDDAQYSAKKHIDMNIIHLATVKFEWEE